MKRPTNMNVLAVCLIALVALVLAASPALTQTANPLPTAITVSSDSNPATAGAAVTLTATVSVVEPETGVATGIVEFFVDGISSGVADLAESGSASVASFSVELSAGMHAVVVEYHGSDSFAPSISSPPLSQQVLEP